MLEKNKFDISWGFVRIKMEEHIWIEPFVKTKIFSIPSISSEIDIWAKLDIAKKIKQSGASAPW